MKKKLLTLLILFVSLNIQAQNFYDINTIQSIQITFSQSNWDYMLDTATAGNDSYIMAQSVSINGTVFDSVGVRYKGNSTYNASQVKNPFHIELDTYKDQDYQGYTDVKLSNVSKDPSFLREVLSYKILRQYMDAPLSNYSTVTVNGTLIGLYVSSESVSKKFVMHHFYSNQNTFYKCNPIGGAGMGSTDKPNLVYLGTDSSLYYPAYELNSDYGWNDLIKLCDTVANNVSAIEKMIDVDRALWMIAFDNTLVNLDSYIGGFSQNYYLYKDNYNRFIPVVWDLNESFGTFSQTGTVMLQNTTAKQQMTHLLHLNDAAWPLIQKLLAVPMYKRMYIAHMRTILAENFSNSNYYTEAQALQSIINSAVNADPNSFFTYAQYQSNLTTDVSSGMTSAPGLTNLMNGRVTYLSAQTDFTYSTPAISTVTPSNGNPVLNSNVTVTASVTNANSNAVYLGYRYSVEAPFIRVLMYDDGAHGDGASGDNVFGVAIGVNSTLIQYYIYAENSNAGMFSPERAEHEFYLLNATAPAITAGELVINEFMARNVATVTDQNGQHDNWIELYNNTSNYLSLNNAFLSDDNLNPLKWDFPENVTVAPHGYLIVWADEDSSQSGLHSNFKLLSSGERIILSYAGGYVVDSISYGAQTADMSYLRCPNGTGSFETYYPSFNGVNCLFNSVEQIQQNDVSIYPNPTNGNIFINNGNEKIESLIIYNSIGQNIYEVKNMNDSSMEINLSAFSAGFYMIEVNHSFRKKIIRN